MAEPSVENDGPVWCACKRYGPVHVFEPGESCRPDGPIPPATSTTEESP